MRHPTIDEVELDFLKEVQVHAVEAEERLCLGVVEHVILEEMQNTNLPLHAQYSLWIQRSVGSLFFVARCTCMDHIHRHLVPKEQFVWVVGVVEQLWVYPSTALQGVEVVTAKVEELHEELQRAVKVEAM